MQIKDDLAKTSPSLRGSLKIQLLDYVYKGISKRGWLEPWSTWIKSIIVWFLSVKLYRINGWFESWARGIKSITVWLFNLVWPLVKYHWLLNMKIFGSQCSITLIFKWWDNVIALLKVQPTLCCVKRINFILAPSPGKHKLQHKYF